jgi:alpha-galactosidase
MKYYDIIMSKKIFLEDIMKNDSAKLKIAYIGGGSRGWAWNLMKDLALTNNLSGTVDLYDIDFSAAKDNELIGNTINKNYPDAGKWTYRAVKEIGEALTGADFVIISILPATFEEMRVDVHAPEKYGIYQAVGDTTGPGGIIRSLRTIPMYEYIANAIKKYSPNAWVINYTNPMAVCTNTLYKVFPEIKAFGCCHEVFGTQKILAAALEEFCGIKDVKRDEIKVNVIGINHFTWLTSVHYKNIDLMPIYKKYVEKYIYVETEAVKDDNWMNNVFRNCNWVKYHLFQKYGIIAAAGDRHLSEFCPSAWYSKTPELVNEWKFGLTDVDWRIKDLGDRLEKSKLLISGKEKLDLVHSGEEGVRQMQAISGLGDLITNVNLPNKGQISNLPLGTVVETNAIFTSDTVLPVMAGAIPDSILGLVSSAAAVQDMTVEAGLNRDLDLAFKAFSADSRIEELNFKDAKNLFDEMISGTKDYLKDYLK